MNKILLVGALALSFSAQALLVQTSKGTYEVVQTPGGFDVYGLSGQGNTTIINHGNGYSVIGPNGTSNIYLDPGENTRFSIDPETTDLTPIPGFPER